MKPIRINMTTQGGRTSLVDIQPIVIDGDNTICGVTYSIDGTIIMKGLVPIYTESMFSSFHVMDAIFNAWGHELCRAESEYMRDFTGVAESKTPSERELILGLLDLMEGKLSVPSTRASTAKGTLFEQLFGRSPGEAPKPPVPSVAPAAKPIAVQVAKGNRKPIVIPAMKSAPKTSAKKTSPKKTIAKASMKSAAQTKSVRPRK